MLICETAIFTSPGGKAVPRALLQLQSILILLGEQVGNKDSSFFTN